MRLISYRTGPSETLAVVDGDRALPAQAFSDPGTGTMAELLAGGDAAVRALAGKIDPARIREEGQSLDELTLLSPVPRPGKVVAVGRNYREHAAEEGVDPPTAPLLFAKWPTAVVGHRAEIRWDTALTTKVDWEAELGVVIGRRTRRVGVAEALDSVFGYTCLNDVSARDLQFADGQWSRAKSLDTFCPIGPVVVTRDELPDAGDLEIRCLVNGEEVQHARTSAMYFGVAEIISYCSQAFTLEPGDVIATGTPSGVGHFRKPPRYLGDGDEVTVEIERIGRLVNVCRIESPTEGRAA